MCLQVSTALCGAWCAQVIFAHFFALPDSVGAVPASDKGSFEDTASALDKVCAAAKHVLEKSAGALRHVHEAVFPKAVPPATIEGLADALAPGSSSVSTYARAQVVGGSDMAFLLLLGHGFSGDFERAVSSFPKKVAITDAVRERAGALSKNMMTMLEERAAALAKRASRSRSESAS